MNLLKITSLIAFLLFLSAPIFSQDKEQRNVASFHSIHVGDGIDLFIYQSDQQKVIVESSSDLDEIITEVSNGVLKIRHKNNMNVFRWGNDENVYVYLPELKEINCSGGSDAESGNFLNVNVLKINASGGSDVKLEVKANGIELECSGGSDAYLSGSTTLLNAGANGGSDIKAYELIVKEAILHASGGSDIQINVQDKIKAKASGGSDIYYKGNPEYTNIDSSSGSDVHKR